MKFPRLFLLALAFCCCVSAQTSQPAKIELGSRTAKDGFRNETQIAAKFNNWKADEDAKVWLAFMKYNPPEIIEVSAAKPHGEKADVQVRIKTGDGEFSEGISIKLVSTANGFNQIDKRWLGTYAKMWKMPADIVNAMNFFVGENKPNKPSRNAERMFLNELDTVTQRQIVEFFTANKREILSDIFKGDGASSAGWMMVALKTGTKPRWVLRSIDYAIDYFGNGDVAITRSGNLRIGRITVQRKGGDGGRETAKMLQFKINPALLFDAK